MHFIISKNDIDEKVSRKDVVSVPPDGSICCVLSLTALAP